MGVKGKQNLGEIRNYPQGNGQGFIGEKNRERIIGINGEGIVINNGKKKRKTIIPGNEERSLGAMMYESSGGGGVIGIGGLELRRMEWNNRARKIMNCTCIHADGMNHGKVRSIH